tara:strand:+ start:186 stop:593 length:408 start_codon:yes stop_codon:yes gene_type:complete
MKKQSSFKMKGFSGFGNSPAKNVLDTKLKDVPKKAKKAVKKGVDRLKNMTVRDVMRVNPIFRSIDNRRRRKRLSEVAVEGAGGGAAEALGSRRMKDKISKTMRKVGKPVKIQTIPRKSIKKLPVKPKMRFNQFSN